MRTIERARAEAARGNLWRAKEILQGSLRSFEYNLELYEEYGRVLLLMGDLPAAGKFLFLSGARKPEYDDAIGLYLRKHQGSPAQLFDSFPRKARLVVLSTYPDVVERELRNLGFPNNLSLFPGNRVHRDKARASRAATFTFLMIALVIGMLVILGIIKLHDIDLWLGR